MRYLWRRTVHALVLLAVVSALTFMLSQIAPGEFFSELRLSPQISAGSIEAWRTQNGLDVPLTQRYFRWLKSVLHGDFGPSLAYNLPAGRLLWDRAKNTLLLTMTAMIISWFIAVPLALWTASLRNGFVTQSFGALMAVLLAFPEIVLAFALIVLASHTGWFPIGGMRSAEFEDLSNVGKVRDVTAHLILPTCTIVLGTIPIIARHTRSAVLDIMNAPFIRAAQCHGLLPRTILFKYLLRASVSPLISLLGISIGALLSGSILVEVITGWPGIGPLLLEAILARDLNIVLGAIILSTLFLLTGNLITDVLLYASDPRIRGAQS